MSKRNIDFPSDTVSPGQSGRYVCPGETEPISRAVHLGRLSNFYEACRGCDARYDTAPLSASLVRKIQRWHEQPQATLWHDEGIEGDRINALDAEKARCAASAMGVYAAAHPGDSDGPDAGGFSAADDTPGLRPAAGPEDAATDRRPVSIAIAGDGSPESAELLAAVSEGVRWTGCDVVDVAAASSGSLATTLVELGAGGAILIGAASGNARRTGLSFYSGSGRPISRGGGLEEIAALLQGPIDRPTRRQGAVRRAGVSSEYRELFQGRFHALRPLRVVLDCRSKPLAALLHDLCDGSGCRFIRTGDDTIAETIGKGGGHCGVWIDGIGERIELWDERGRRVDADELLWLFAAELCCSEPGSLPGQATSNSEPGCLPGQATSNSEPWAVVLESATRPAVGEWIIDAGGEVVVAGATRSEMFTAARQSGAVLGGGPSGRYWFACSAVPLADALCAVSLLLAILSKTDRPLSQVVRESIDGR